MTLKRKQPLIGSPTGSKNIVNQKDNTMNNYIRSTKDYERFELHPFNRDVKKIKKLEASMKSNGWILAYPLHCTQENGKFVIKDGHHRLHVAKKIGIPVKFVVCEDKIEITDLIETASPWTPHDFLVSYVRAGRAAYIAVKEYMEETGIPLGLSVSLLAGESAGSANKVRKFRAGTYALGDPTHAGQVKAVVLHMKSLGVPFATNSLFVQALSKMLRVKGFSVVQFKKKLSKHVGVIERQPSLEAYLTAIEKLYNRGSKTRLPLAFMATETAKKRHLNFGKN